MRIASVLLLICLSLGCSAAASQSELDAGGSTSKVNPRVLNKFTLMLDMRVLWEDHINYTRNYIIAALNDLPMQDEVAERLLQNQDEIGDAIEPFYGAAAGDALAELLREHIMIATEVIAAAKLGAGDDLVDAQTRWEANADEIAAFLAGANSNWDEAELRDMLQVHLEETTGEVTAQLAGDWAADIAHVDANHHHMLMFSDMLVDGIAAQFPKQFK